MKDIIYEGKIKQYHADRGFGFIVCSEGEIFFHISEYPVPEEEPKRNERVKFKLESNGDKLKAIRIQRVEDKSAKAKKTKIVNNNQSITSNLLSNFKR